MKKWIIQHPISLSTHDLSVLHVAYSLLITPQSVQTYVLLSSFSMIREGSFTSHDIAIHLNVFDHQIEPLIQSCVSVGLIEWYEQSSMTLLVLKQPFNISKLMKHPMFGRILSTHESLYLSAFHMKFPAVNAQSKPVQYKYESRQVSWDDHEEKQFLQTQVPLSSQSFFNTKLFLELCEEVLFPQSLRTPGNIKAIENLANQYLVDENSMRKHIAKCINYKTVFLNFDKLALLLANEHKAYSFKDTSYNQHHFSFFTAINEGRSIVLKDKQLIEYLRNQYTFDQETFNFLLESILKSYYGRFTKKNAEHMAESWLRAKVKNLDDAKKYVSSHLNQTITKVKALPDYYEQEEDQNTDKEALLKKLKELDDERNSS